MILVVIAQAPETTESENTARVPEIATLGHKEGTKFRPLRNIAKMIRKIVEAPGVEPGSGSAPLMALRAYPVIGFRPWVGPPAGHPRA